MFHRARRLSPSLHLPKTKNHRNNGAFPRYSLDIFRRAFETGHERAAYALRISRMFLQFHPPATKDRFSDDNPLIHCALHCFSIFPLSLSLRLFFRDRETATREYYFRLGSRVCVFYHSRMTKTRDNFVSKRKRKTWKRLGKGRRGES